MRTVLQTIILCVFLVAFSFQAKAQTAVTTFEALKTAIQNANDNDEILISTFIMVTEPVTMPVGKHITLKTGTGTASNQILMWTAGFTAPMVTIPANSGLTLDNIALFTDQSSAFPLVKNQGRLTMSRSSGLWCSKVTVPVLHNQGTFTLINGSIQSTGSVTGVHNDGENAVVVMNGGEISQCGKADQILLGGGIFNDGGNVTINGGKIQNNKAGKGAGIYSTGTLTITGGTFKDNVASEFGSGILSVGNTYLSGSPQFSGDNGLYVPSEQYAPVVTAAFGTNARIQLEGVPYYTNTPVVGAKAGESLGVLTANEMVSFSVVGDGYTFSLSEDRKYLILTEGGATFAGGDGTAEDPWQIADAEQLDLLRKYLGRDYRSKHYILTQDIDLTEFLKDGGVDGLGWLPIGDDQRVGTTSLHNSFQGIFDGKGHTIRGLWINRPDMLYVGLFGIIGETGLSGSVGEIQNTNLVIDAEKGGVKGKTYVGGLVGYLLGCDAENCTVTQIGEGFGVTSRGGWGGGMFGIAQGNVINSSASVNVKGTERGSDVGGLAGEAFSLTDCYATGDVFLESENGSAGGLCGDGRKMIRCFATGNVTLANVTDGGQIGGLAGRFSMSSNGLIEQCFASGLLISHSSECQIGGLAGYYDTSNGRIADSYSTSTIFNTSTGRNCYLGGITGWLLGDYTPDNPQRLEKSYAASLIGGGRFRGGVVGVKYEYATIESPYYRTDDSFNPGISGITFPETERTAVPLALAQMTGNTARGNMPTLDFDAVWIETPDNGNTKYYPQLRAFAESADDFVRQASLASVIAESDSRNLMSIEVTTPPDRTSYKLGETLDLSGLVVTAHYQDGSSREVTDYLTGPSNGYEVMKHAEQVWILYTEGGESHITSFPLQTALSTDVYTVTTTINKVDEADGVTSLQEAILMTVGGNGGTIKFDIPTTDPGYADGAWTIQFPYRMPIFTQPTIITGADAGGEIILRSAPDGDRHFVVDADLDITLENLTLIGPGKTLATEDDSYGGIVYNYTGTKTLTLRNCTFIDCVNNSTSGGNLTHLHHGGAVNAKNVVIENCVFTGNAANAPDASGGAVYASGKLTVINSTISGNNAASHGGGLYGNIVELISSTVTGNTASGNGSGIYAVGAADIYGSIVSGNGTNKNVYAGGSYWSENTAPGTANHYSIIGQPRGYSLEEVFGSNTPTLADNGGLTRTILIKSGGPAHNIIPTTESWLPATDQRGEPRPETGGTLADVGAVERKISVSSSTYHPDDKAALRAFLRQPTATYDGSSDKTLNIDILWDNKRLPIDTVNWETDESWVDKVRGIKWDVSLPNRVERITWSNSSLAGNLDVSACTNLRIIESYNNHFTALNVEGCTNLTELNFSQNKLTTLDLSNNKALETLHCDENKLTSLILPRTSVLDYISCEINQLTSLDVQGCTALTYLYCGNNKLTSLNLEGCAALVFVRCSINQLTELDFSDNLALITLHCESNSLTMLDISANILLEGLYCKNNRLSSLDISENTKLIDLCCQHNLLTQLDVSTNSVLAGILCFNNKLRFSTLPANVFEEGDYLYAPQDTLQGGTMLVNSTVDLNGEKTINGVHTVYRWYDITSGGVETEVTAQVSDDGSGRFTFASELAGRKLRCKMTNTDFPDLTLVYEVTLTTLSQPHPAAIVTQPVGADLCNGDNYRLSVEAAGDGLTYQWYFDDRPIDGANTHTYTITHADAAIAGRYYVVVSGSYGNSIRSNEVVIRIDCPTGNDVVEAGGLQVYPNPVTDHLYVSTETSSIESVRVYTLTGKAIYTQTIRNSQVTIPAYSWNKGIYILWIQTREGIHTKKIIKQ